MRRFALISFAALFMASAINAMADDGGAQANGLTSVSGIPLYIDGNISHSRPLQLSPSLLDQVRSVKTLGDALRILGPSYITPGDNLRIPHWHFQDGQMLTLWPQGGETLTDTVSVAARPDCGVPAEQCKDLVLNRKKGSGHSHGGGSGGSSGGGSSMLSPLMHMMR